MLATCRGVISVDASTEVNDRSATWGRGRANGREDSSNGSLPTADLCVLALAATSKFAAAACTRPASFISSSMQVAGGSVSLLSGGDVDWKACIPMSLAWIRSLSPLHGQMVLKCGSQTITVS